MFYIDFPSWIKPQIIPGLPVRWYGLMYIVAFGLAYWFFQRQIKEDGIKVEKDQVGDYFFWGIVGLILGARLFSVFIYSDERLYYFTHPWMIFWPMQNGRLVGLQGMSYHGGVVGGAAGFILYCKRKKLNVWLWGDMICTAIPFGYTFGRLGNFINGELYGRVSTGPLGMRFPQASRFSLDIDWVRQVVEEIGLNTGAASTVNLPRHPSQLYEALFEGIVLGLILWFVIRPRKPFHGFMIGSYIFGYGFFRFIIEYFREPDANLGYVINWGPEENFHLHHSLFNLSTGQILCFLMMASGVGIILWARKASKK
ncbi:MAG: prolipoprotein diacylglyceryl transferase [Spirochaetales bacterium]|nr:prolipoprotein diacylglyceryl transferase [Spirochaetales bacterium]